MRQPIRQLVGVTSDDRCNLAAVPRRAIAILALILLGVVAASNGKIYAIGGEYGHDLLHNQQSLVQAYDPIAKTWSQVSSLPTARSHFESGTFVWDGKIFCAGGQIADYKSTDEVDMYDPSLNKWTIVGRLPAVLQGPVVQRVGNEIIVTTGNKGDLVPLATTWIGDV